MDERPASAAEKKAAASWVPAHNLRPGHKLLARSGATFSVSRAVLNAAGPLQVVEIYTEDLHNYAIGARGVVVHNRNPALAAGQAHVVTVPGTGAQVNLTLPPIDMPHIVNGCILPGTALLDGFHHFTTAAAIQRGVAILLTGHAVMTTTAAGLSVMQNVNMRVVPLVSATHDAPFDASVEVLDPATHAVIATKASSSFFPVNWSQQQITQAAYEAMIHYVENTGLQPIGRGISARTDFNVRLQLRVQAGAGGIPVRVYSAYPHGAQPGVTAAQAPQ
jgi:hypothetical protein